MDLSAFFITRAQATDFSSKLTAMTDTMYTTHFSLEEALSNQFGIQKKDAFLKLFRDNNINTTQTADVQNFLKKIQDTVTNLLLVELTIAFEPTEEILRALSQWFLTTLNKQVLLEVIIHPSLIAGAKITCNGKFKEYSLTSQFGKIVEQVLSTTSAPTTPHQNTQYMEIGR